MNMDITDRNQLNQIVMEFYAASMNLVLVSRIPAFTSASSQYGKRVQSKAKISPIVEKIRPCSSGIWEPMIIDILLLRNKQEKTIGSRNIVRNGTITSQIGQKCTGFKVSESEQSILLERWTFHFSEFSSNRLENEFSNCRTLNTATQQAISNDSLQRANQSDEPVVICSRLQGLQMMMTILSRSLYCTTRLLPAQSLFRSLCCSVGCNFMLDYRISTSPFPISTNLKNMKHHCLRPVDTDIGCMYISVSYQPVAPVPIQDPPMRISEIISDYADNVSAVRLKQFQNQSQSPNHKSPFSEVEKLQDQFSMCRKINECGEKPEAIWTRTAQTNAYVPVDDNEFECPFAVDNKGSRMESPGCSSSISTGVSIGSLIALLRSPEPLRGMHEQDNGDFLVVGKQRKTANDALRELKLYIDVRDSLK